MVGAELTYRDLPEVDAVVKGAPGALLEVGCPGLLDALAHALALLPLQPIPSRDPRCPRDPIGSRVSIPSRNATGAL